MHPFRVFISYSSKDRSVVERIDADLHNMNLIPVWDRGIQPGRSFTDAIKKQIATAHVFMPLITKSSYDRPWVHEEIGFALGIDVPVIPVALGSFPQEMLKEMLAGIQSVFVKDDLSDLVSKLEQTDIEALVLSDGELQRLRISPQVADFPEKRTELLIELTKTAPESSRIRQRAIFSSFSLPDEGPGHSVWDGIELRRPRSDFFRGLLQQERQLLDKYARKAGCSLIISPFIDFVPVGARVHRTQLQILLTFLKSMPRSEITVGIVEQGFAGSLTLVGDWVGASAFPPQPGSEYLGTVFTSHAPTVLSWLRKFDDELNRILRAANLQPDQSRDAAILRIEERLRNLPNA